MARTESERKRERERERGGGRSGKEIEPKGRSYGRGDSYRSDRDPTADRDLLRVDSRRSREAPARGAP
eukprot:3906977-Rhodomonas_salina.1